MTTANKITIVRVFAVPVFISLVLYYGETGNEFHRLLAIAVFAFAAVSDGVDGFIARRFNQRSELGAILDPMADKLLLVSGVVLLSQNYQPHLSRIPLWLTAIIIGRDVILTIGLIVIYYAGVKVSVRPSLVGKAATVLQMIVVLWILLKWSPDWLQIWILGAGICTAVSGAFYFVEGWKLLSASPTSAATPGQGKSEAAKPKDIDAI
jgi:cardiolipin synthase (CMP-forming)